MRRGTPACAAECFCDACGVDSHATEHCEAFKAAEARPGVENEVSIADYLAPSEDGHGEDDDRGGDGEVPGGGATQTCKVAPPAVAAAIAS